MNIFLSLSRFLKENLFKGISMLVHFFKKHSIDSFGINN